MQMYQVQFTTHYENMVEVGTTLVCAGNSDQAIDLVLVALDLPKSRTECRVVRIKPSVYQLERKELFKPAQKELGNNESAPGREPHIPSVKPKFQCRISATVFASNEENAVRRLLSAVTEKMGARTALYSGHTRDMVIDCVPVLPKRAINAMEQVELYRPTRFMRG